ncbi:PorP/SprF family type IX secretion system membrane protein [Chryseolinea lacunae]|uniref:Type IX secretion system membrane protein PorP/SprF n=1 Tax=Chryseolinea lacunae TaxID=2801331 RepID=A0ABS1KPR1_9BACT|nr:type IX secretion system membrane protein PorP/SprF [Chryseolinea lacunae]MBL0741435.1 type IX secretion system membrane protein PorP/SprF [Chryseolinea lacunae]
MKTKSPYRFIRLLMLAGMLVVFAPQAMAQQKVQFSQYMFNTLVINPAYAGADEALSLTLIHRSQWNGLEGAPTTQTLSGHTLFKKKHFGVGATIVNDKIGVHRNLSILSDYAYHLQVGKTSFLSMGLQAGIHNTRADYASLMGGVTNDPKLNSASISQTFFDFGAGVYFRSSRLHVGLSAPELVPERISFNDTVSVRLSRTNFFLFAKYRITQNENIDYEPSLLLKYMPGLPLSFDVNINMIYRKVLTLGLSYRKSESVDFLFKGQVTPQFQIGYAYDHVIGDVARISNGSHEIMVQYLFKYVETKVSSPR